MPHINENIQRLPDHLRQFIVDQHYEKYTAVDHAVWRYIMRLNSKALEQIAHPSYLKGLKATGININHIPKIEEMNTILSKIGWGAVCVDGFIPPAAFMEFQAYKILVIAADMRHIKHIEYTPAPDIVHEAAGHAPIIVDPAYAEYLRLFGEIGSKALSSKRDYDLYESIRKLSILKENPDASNEEILQVEEELKKVSNSMGPASEMAKLRNLHWWTVEYGLVGDIKHAKLYGAGLLSSIGESEACLNENVKKINYSAEASEYNFDITTQQPQLFVTPNFTHLISVLNQFADKMAFRTGGIESLKMAIESEGLNSCELDSGLQISGVFTNVIETSNREIAYINTTGPTMLSESNKMLIGHGTSAHRDGFGTPIGKLLSPKIDLNSANLEELAARNIKVGAITKLEFESGVMVEGHLDYIRQNNFGKNIIMSFSDCTVHLDDNILFMPEWGVFDMAIGTQITSVFSGAADKSEFKEESHVSSTTTVVHNYNDKEYIQLYQSVDELRKHYDAKELTSLFESTVQKHPHEWLLILELFELAFEHEHELKTQLLKHLHLIEKNKPEYATLIKNGLSLLNH